MGFTHPHSRQVAHVYYQLFDSKMADGDQLWSVWKLENDLLRRNASTNGRKTDLIERYILHWKPNHTIYVRYFSILLYFLNVQVAPTENKTDDDGSVWMCFRDRILHMIAYLYFKVKKILKIVKKLMFFLKKNAKSKMFLKNRIRVPILLAP
jgi:hypothetical protein